MGLLYSLFVAWNLALFVRMIEMNKDSDEELLVKGEDPCINVFCHAGQECIVVDGDATCVCKTKCPNHDSPVCGSNGMTFPNHCELHKTACLEGKKISLKHNGECKGQASMTPPTLKVNRSKPVVCYERDRDEFRHHLIKWLQNQDESMEEVKGYRKLLRAYFNLVDENNDGKLDGTEFKEFIKTNDSIGKVSSSDRYVNPILQSLCADALISISDDDSDWELSFEEFAKCLDPEFKPPKKGCDLRNQVYKDGTEIPINCNSCVCACGHWVCTALKCDGESNTNQASDETNDEAKKSKFIVKGEEAKQQLTREMMDSEEQERKKVLPLLKP